MSILFAEVAAASGNQSIQSVIAMPISEANTPIPIIRATGCFSPADPRIRLGRALGLVRLNALPLAHGARVYWLVGRAARLRRLRAGPRRRGASPSAESPTGVARGGGGRPWRTGRPAGSRPRAATSWTGSEPSSSSWAARAIRIALELAAEARAAGSANARCSCRREVAISCATLASERSSSP